MKTLMLYTCISYSKYHDGVQLCDPSCIIHVAINRDTYLQAHVKAKVEEQLKYFDGSLLDHEDGLVLFALHEPLGLSEVFFVLLHHFCVLRHRLCDMHRENC